MIKIWLWGTMAVSVWLALGQENVLENEGKVESNGESVAVALGSHHTCALEYRPGVEVPGSGPARCWGRNEVGESTPHPDDMFIQLSAGDRHTCGLMANHEVKCWGFGNVAFPPPTGGLFQQISAGGSHTCGLTLDGTIHCWGDDMHGKTKPPPHNKSTFIQVSAGGSFSCGLKSNGIAQCWGKNHRGQADPPTDVRFHQISTSGTDHACGVTMDESRDIVCWGRNMRGEGDKKEGPWQHVSVGRWLTCGVKTDGGAECWGIRIFKNLGPFNKFMAFWHHVCGVDRDTLELTCWGDASGAQNVPDDLAVA